MGVLIKGMEMPQNCAECFVGFCKQIGCEHYIGFNDYAITRHPDCPLVPVPPHGRLIDADALDIYQRAEAAYAEYQEDEDNFYLEGMANGLCEAAKQLSVARTIIPASEESKT